MILGRALRSAGIDAVYGAALPGLATVPAAPGCARLLAEAHPRVVGTRAAAHLGRGELIEARAGERAPYVAAVGADLAAAVVAAFSDAGPGWLRLEGDLEADVGDPAVPAPGVEPDPWDEPGEATLSALAEAEAPVVLAGPGVLARHEVAALHGLAAAASVGVLNTWGAKGVFPWRSRHHLATAGLQARDFELGGLGGADLILATGLDPDESPDARWRLNTSVELEPSALAPVGDRWVRSPRPIPVPPLRSGLAAATQAGWARSGSPIAPSLVTRNYGAALGRSGLVAADPGIAGFWVARTFSTAAPGTVMVPARRGADGLAVAAALVARLARPARRVLAVVDRLTDPTRELLDLAARAGIAVPLEVWSDDGMALDGDSHLARLARLIGSDAPAPMSLLTARDQLAAMLDVAGPVVAWGGIPGGG